MPRAAARVIPHGRANARRAHPTQPVRGRRSRRVDLQLITSDADAEMYVARRRRAPRPRRIDPDRVAKDPGRELKRLRRGLRTSIEQAAAETKIGARYLEALEANATSEAFPAAAYARAFLREYACFLRVDPEPFLASHAATQPEPPSTVLGRVLREPIGRPFRLPGWLLPACIAIGAFILLVSTGDRDRPEVTGLFDSPAAHASSGPAVTAPEASSPAGPALDESLAVEPGVAREIAVEVRVVASCWVRAVADGKVVAERTLRSGAELRVLGTRTVDLVLGNVRAAGLVINGSPYELGGASGSVATVHMTLENGRVEISVA